MKTKVNKKKPLSMRAKAKRKALYAFVKLSEERISRGVIYLNKNKPNWWEDTQLDTLNLSQTDSCMLGQAFDDFWNRVLHDSQNPKDYPNKMSMGEAENKGFLIQRNYNVDHSEYDILTALWVERIAQIRLLNKFGIKTCGNSLIARR
jgi:hypothetical protein